MNKRTAVTALIVLTIFGVVAMLYLKRGSASNLRPFQALGVVAAQETAKLIGGSGQIVIIEPDMGESNNQAKEAQIKSFLDEIKKQTGVTIAATEKFSLFPGQPQQTGKKQNQLRFMEPTLVRPPSSQPGQLSQIANTHAEAKAIVAFVDLPPFSDADFPTLKNRDIKLVVVSEYKEGYKALFQAQILRLAIVPRWEPFRETGKKPRTMKDWFDRSYTMITPEKAEAMP